MDPLRPVAVMSKQRSWRKIAQIILSVAILIVVAYPVFLPSTKSKRTSWWMEISIPIVFLQTITGPLCNACNRSLMNIEALNQRQLARPGAVACP